MLAGAWPVTGFFGLDVALLYLAFRLSYRSARQRESLRLTQQALDVERVGIRGERQRWQLEPTWLRVTLDENEQGRGQLILSLARQDGWACRLPRRRGTPAPRRRAQSRVAALARFAARLTSLAPLRAAGCILAPKQQMEEPQCLSSK